MESVSRLPAPRSLPAWILLAGLSAATLDILYATGFWALKGVPASRILQSVAAGVLGKASFSGGLATAAPGAGAALRDRGGDGGGVLPGGAPAAVAGAAAVDVRRALRPGCTR